MATSQATADHVCEQAAGAGRVSSRRMFGEFALYVAGKVVGLICDEQLFVKPTEAGRAWLARETGADAPALASPFPGAKLYLLIPGELWDDRAFLAGLLSETARDLPEPKPKKAKPEKAKPGKAKPGKAAKA